MPAEDDSFGPEGQEQFSDTGATVQMDPSEISELHRRLAAVAAAPASARAPQPGTLQAPPREVAPAPAPVRARMAPPAPPQAPPHEESAAFDEELPAEDLAEPAAPAPAPPRPAAPAPAPPQPSPVAADAAKSGAGLLVAGGIGGLLVCILTILRLPPIASELPREAALYYVLGGAAVVAYALFAVGLSAASRLTNALAGVAAIFAYLTVVGSIAALALLPELTGDTAQAVAVVVFFLPWVTWLFAGLWGLASGAAMGVLGVLGGLFGLLGGLAGAGIGVVRLVGGITPDVLAIMGYTAYGGIALGGLLIGIAFLTGIKQHA